MDLLKVHLRNFTSYQSTEINLENLHVVGLLGSNGSGKSSLIEGIVWALYGTTSKGGRKEADNYVRVGSDECSVSVEFMLGELYRVERTWNKAQRRGRLGLFVFREGEWQLRCKTAEETQKQIEAMLRMNYKTFTSTVVSLQGEIGNFTSCTDQERKEILSAILGLDAWDSIQKMVSDDIKDLTKVSLKSLSLEIDRLEQSLKDYTILAEKIAFKDNEALNIHGMIERDQKVCSSLTKEVAIAETELNLVGEFRRRMTAIDEDLKKRASEKDLRLKALESDITWIDSQTVKINEELSNFAKIVEEKDLISKHYERSLEITDELKSIEPSQSLYKETLESLSAIQDLISEWDKSYCQKIFEVSSKLHEAEESFKLLGEYPCTIDMQRQCKLVSSVVKKVDDIEDLRASLSRLHKEKENCPYIGDESVLLKTKEELEKNLARVEELRKELETLNKASKYDMLIQSEESMETLNRNLQSFLGRKEQIQNEIELLNKAWNEQRYQAINAIEDLETQSDTILKSVGDIVSKKQLLLDAEQNITTNRLRLETLNKELGALKQRLSDIEANRALLEDKRIELDELNRNLVIKKIIERAATKKKGVPALIVENAIPEIESFANHILSRVVEGRFSIRLETQIDSKTTDTVQEVLRIFVMDNGVVRPYQTFSGAQKFILDLSLRVAISNFLAHRSGTEIKILVIDEGFGALDESNLSSIMEAILEIAKDFNKVLIVTHLLRLKDLMPQKIYFRDTVEGTEINIID
jgi:exonuclease SbcC